MTRRARTQEPATPIRPIAGTDAWLTTMERAGYQCQCTICPSHRRKSDDGRCPTQIGRITKLLAGPEDPGPDPARSLSWEGDLVAWCIPCWDTRVRLARDGQKLALRENPPEALF